MRLGSRWLPTFSSVMDSCSSNESIRFAQEGLDPITFEVSPQMMDKSYQKIERTNQSVVLGAQITALPLVAPEASDKLDQPLLAEFPDPYSVAVARSNSGSRLLQAEIDEMERHAFVLPVSMVGGEEAIRSME